MSGRVSLVGAGPGDPELLTVRAARALAEADLVFYDSLVSREVLALAPRAQRFSVGKRAGRASMRQEAIHVPHEVVPGITSALAAPALAGIPVTHRGLSSAFTVVSGHAESAWQGVLSGLPPNGLTVVVLMGLGARAAISAFLLDRGWAASTPTALLLAAGTSRAHTWTGPLATLGHSAVPDELGDTPGTIVVGDVVRLAASAVEPQEGAARAFNR